MKGGLRLMRMAALEALFRIRAYSLFILLRASSINP